MDKEQIKTTKKYNMIYECQSFYSASKKLINAISDDLTFSCDTIPCAVNCALTCELALKSLYLILGKDYKKTHYLDELLFNLPGDYLIYILYNYWQRYYKNFDCTFAIDKIFSIAEYFVNIRYLCDYSQVISLYDIQSFMEVVYEMVTANCKVKISPLSSFTEDCQDANEINKKFIVAEQDAINKRKSKFIKTK